VAIILVQTATRGTTAGEASQQTSPFSPASTVGNTIEATSWEFRSASPPPLARDALDMNGPDSWHGEDLETPCNACDGEGQYRKEGEWRRCRRCDGAGYIPTDLGIKVLDLMRHNFRPMLQDAESSE
jgi:hypothetical protein